MRPLASFGHLVQVIRHGLKKIQHRPGLIEGCLAGTGLALEPGQTPTDIKIEDLFWALLLADSGLNSWRRDQLTDSSRPSLPGARLGQATPQMRGGLFGPPEA
jgi:hypothetical protein